MANNQKKLKAFVRYDGSGRVVASSLILRKNKPRVGRWYEIPEYLCCNGVPSSTTTTTTQGGGSTPTAWVAYTSFQANWSCEQINGVSRVLYTSVPTLTTGTILYTDAALTEIYSYFGGTFVAINGTVWEITQVDGPIVNPQSCSSITTTTTTTQVPVLSFIGRGGGNTFTACNGSNETFYTTGPLQFGAYPQNGNVIYFDQALTQLVNYTYVASPGIGQVFVCTDGVLSNQSNC